MRQATAENSGPVTLSDRELLESIAARLDHHDEMLHKVTAVLDELAPYARQAARMLTDNPAARFARKVRHGQP